MQAKEVETAPLEPTVIKRTIQDLKGVSCVYSVVRESLDALRDPEISGRQLDQLLSADQGVAIRVLKLANSAYFGISGHVSTLTMAVGVIGHRRLRLLLERILIAEMLRVLPAGAEPASSIREFGLVAGAVSHDLSSATWAGDPEEMLTVGLLHNVGDLALASLFREQFIESRREAARLPLAEAENAMFGMASGDVGGWLLESWSFPAIYGAACRYWSAPLECNEGSDLLQRLCVVHAAARITTAFVERRDARQAFEFIRADVVELLELRLDTVVSLYEELPGQIQRVRTSLLT